MIFLSLFLFYFKTRSKHKGGVMKKGLFVITLLSIFFSLACGLADAEMQTHPKVQNKKNGVQKIIWVYNTPTSVTCRFSADKIVTSYYDLLFKKSFFWVGPSFTFDSSAKRLGGARLQIYKVFGKRLFTSAGFLHQQGLFNNSLSSTLTETEAKMNLFINNYYLTGKLLLTKSTDRFVLKTFIGISFDMPNIQGNITWAPPGQEQKQEIKMDLSINF